MAEMENLLLNAGETQALASCLTREELGNVFFALLQHAGGEKPSLATPVENLAFLSISGQLDRYYKAYLRKKERNKAYRDRQCAEREAAYEQACAQCTTEDGEVLFAPQEESESLCQTQEVRESACETQKAHESACETKEAGNPNPKPNPKPNPNPNPNPNPKPNPKPNPNPNPNPNPLPNADTDAPSAPPEQERAGAGAEKKKKYAEFVAMTPQEYGRLVSKYGQSLTDRMIELLDNYKGATGKSYRNDYRAVLSWVAERVLANAPIKHPPTPKDEAFEELMRRYDCV